MARQTKAYIALLYVCIIWGTTYLAIRIGVLHYPAFLFAGTRQLTAGILLLTITLFINTNRDLSRRNILRQMLIGFLMLTMGNGFVTWGEKYVPSGIAALLCAMMPMFAVTFNVLSSKKEHFNALIIAGLLSGVCGVALIFRHDIAELSNPAYITGILSVLLATSSWATGSIINKRSPASVNAFFDTGLQLLFGGIFMLIISPCIDNYSGFSLWQPKGLLALGYLIVFGSLLAYTAYTYALRNLPVGIATLYAYINPLVAVLLGYLVLNEKLNIYTGLAFVSIIISVYLMNRGHRKQHKINQLQTQTIAGAFPESTPAES